jgi:hypothetical protein
MAGIYLTGQQELRAVLMRAPQHAQNALGRALWREGTIIMAKSMTQYVPIDMGTLKGSAVVARPTKVGAFGVLVQMGYGGAAKAYAVKQHEDTSLSHPPKRQRKRYTSKGRRIIPKRPGRAKYLSLAMEERAPEIPQNLAIAIDGMFRKIGV